MCLVKYNTNDTSMVPKPPGVPSSEAQQTRIIKHDIMNSDTQKSEGLLTMEMQCLSFLWKVPIVSNDFKQLGSSFHILGTATVREKV